MDPVELSKAVKVLVTGISGAMLILARRYRNKDNNAGWVVAGFTVIVIFIILVAK